MRIAESAKKQLELQDLLLKMSTDYLDENGINYILSKLEIIYTRGFRHKYASFFPLILNIDKSGKGSIDFLSENLEQARFIVEKNYHLGEKKYYLLSRHLTKLTDHINLEIARFRHYSKSEALTFDAHLKIENLKTDINNATEELKQAKETISTVQTELVSVLSIFAAIVLTFSGGMNLIGSALTGIKEAPFFKSVFFILLCGFVVFNTIFLMMYMVGKITKRNIYAKCKSVDCTCGENGTPKCNSITRLKKRLPYIFWFNVLILSILIIDLICWGFFCLYPQCFIIVNF